VKLTLETLPRYATECGDCLLWNQGLHCKGYPQANIDGRPQLVRRYIFTELLGREIPKGCVVSSRCNEKLCIAPGCLMAMRWGKVQERSYRTGQRGGASEYAARLRSAERQGRLRLDWDKVREIRRRPDSATLVELAAEFGVSRRCIWDVRRGVSWRQQMPASSVFSWSGPAATA
jgi:hypothetical protein